MPSFYEFFAGGGMARAGLGDGWTCLFANDFSQMKARAYKENWGDDHFVAQSHNKLRHSYPKRILAGSYEIVDKLQDSSLIGSAKAKLL